MCKKIYIYTDANNILFVNLLTSQSHPTPCNSAPNPAQHPNLTSPVLDVILNNERIGKL